MIKIWLSWGWKEVSKRKKTFFLVSQVLSFTHTKQNSEDVVDKSFKFNFEVYKCNTFFTWHFKLGWNLLRSSRNTFSFSWPYIQIKNIFPIYLTQTVYLFVSKNSVSNLSMKLLEYVGAHIIPIAVPEIRIWLGY